MWSHTQITSFFSRIVELQHFKNEFEEFSIL